MKKKLGWEIYIKELLISALDCKKFISYQMKQTRCFIRELVIFISFEYNLNSHNKEQIFWIDKKSF